LIAFLGSEGVICVEKIAGLDHVQPQNVLNIPLYLISLCKQKPTVLATKLGGSDARVEPKFAAPFAQTRFDGRGLEEGDALPSRRSIYRDQRRSRSPVK